MDTSTLDKKYDTFVERYSHKPSIDQFKRFAQIKYMDAKKYITSRKQDRKTSADLPTKSSPTLLPKSRTIRAQSTYNNIPSPPKQIKTNTINTIITKHNGHKYEECKEKETEKEIENPPETEPTITESNNININMSQSMPISLNKHKHNNSISKALHSPSQHTRFLPLMDDNKNGHIHIDENYYNLNRNRLIYSNSSGQDLRKYSGIDANDSNGYYHDMIYNKIPRDRRGNLYDNINNPYLDNTILQCSTSIINPFKLHVAVDFGTDGIAIAYCLPNGNVYIHNNWKGEKINNNNNIKIKSRILLDENGDMLSFGTAASYMYSNINKNNHKNWMLFERFKMNLYSNNVNDNINNKQAINLREYLTATNGILYESKKVFICVFKYIKQQVFYYLKKLKLHNNIKHIQDIQWIITVPAIWDDIAKNKMREWAIDAGLADDTIPNHIKIVYEPDCASLCIQHKISQMLKRKKIISAQIQPDMDNEFNIDVEDNIELFNIGSKYLLIDAGGGTVDISAHESMDNMKIKEIFHPTGGAWGSTYIDDEFVKLLNNIFTAEWMNKFMISDSHSYYQLLNNFRQSKHTFYNSNNKQTHNVNLTYEFISFLEEECEIYDIYLDDIIGKSMYSNDIKLNGEYLEISYNIWTNLLFDVVINPIIKHINILLNKPQMKYCKYICLVGGLASSKYFQYRINNEFSDKLIIIIPKRPIQSVVEGAAMFGLYNTFVQGRVLAKCYGTSVNSKHLTKSWMNKKMVLNLSNEEKQKHYNHKRECYSKIFKPIVHKNQSISIDGKPIIIEGARNTSNKIQKHTTVKIYQCDEYNDNSNTFFINNNGNMKLMATACIVWPKDDKQRNKIILELYFHDTIICGYVYAEKYANDKKVLQLKYQFQ